MICQGEKFLSCQERTLEFGWGMRQRYQFQWNMWGSITKVLVTFKAPLCVSHNLQWKQPLKGSLLVFFVWAHWGLGQWCEDAVSEAGTAVPVPVWMPTCLLSSCQPSPGDKVISVTFSCSLLLVQGLLLLNQKLIWEIKLKDMKEADV